MGKGGGLPSTRPKLETRALSEKKKRQFMYGVIDEIIMFGRYGIPSFPSWFGSRIAAAGGQDSADVLRPSDYMWEDSPRGEHQSASNDG